MGAPYLVDNYDQVLRLTASPLFKGWVDKLRNAANLQVLSFDWFQGHRHVLTNVPVKMPADLKGIRMRTPGAPVWLETVRAMGATPTGMPWSEVYSALQTKVIDGAEAQHPGGLRRAPVRGRQGHHQDRAHLPASPASSRRARGSTSCRPTSRQILTRGVGRRGQVGVREDDRVARRLREEAARKGRVGRRDRQDAVQTRHRRRLRDAGLHRPAHRSEQGRSASKAMDGFLEAPRARRGDRCARVPGGCSALVFVAAVSRAFGCAGAVGDRHRDAAVHLVRVPRRRRGAPRAPAHHHRHHRPLVPATGAARAADHALDDHGRLPAHAGRPGHAAHAAQRAAADG